MNAKLFHGRLSMSIFTEINLRESRLGDESCINASHLQVAAEATNLSPNFFFWKEFKNRLQAAFFDSSVNDA